MKRFFSIAPIIPDKGIGIVRIIIGAFLLYHGREVFDSELMKGYMEWENFKGSAGAFMVYAGKGAEFIAGLFLFLGLFTRVGAFIALGRWVISRSLLATENSGMTISTRLCSPCSGYSFYSLALVHGALIN